MKPDRIRLTLGGGTAFTATLADNSSAKALAELLSKGSLTLRMQDYGGMEKVGPLGTLLPRNDRPLRTAPGDLILYLGTYLTIYYSANAWTLTRLGRIDNAAAEELRRALGPGDVSVTLSALP